MYLLLYIQGMIYVENVSIEASQFAMEGGMGMTAAQRREGWKEARRNG